MKIKIRPNNSKTRSFSPSQDSSREQIQDQVQAENTSAGRASSTESEKLDCMKK